MIALWVAVAMLAAVLLFEAGSRWQLRRERRRHRRLADHMQTRLDERLRAAHRPARTW